MQKDQSQSEHEDPLEQIQQSLQKNIFMVLYQLLSQLQHAGPWLFYLIETLETIQLLRFSLHPVLKYQDQGIGIPQVKVVLNYLSVDYLLKQYPQCLVVVLSIMTLLIVGYAAAIATVWYFAEKPRSSVNMWNLLITICNLLVLVCNNLLIIPLTELTCNLFLCNSGWQCYDTTYTLYLSLCVLMGVIMLVSLALYSVLFYLKNPFHRSLMSKPSNICKLVKAGIKVAASCYFIIDTQGQYHNVYIYGYAVVLGGYLFLFREVHHYNQKYFYFGYFCEIFMLVFSLTTIMQYYVSQEGVKELTLFYTVMCAMPLFYIARRVDVLGKKHILVDSIKDKSSQSAEIFAKELIQMTEDCRQQNTDILLLPIVKLIHASCETPEECACNLYLADFKPATKRSPEKHLQNVYKFIEYILKQSAKSYPKNNYFILTQMYLLYFRMHSKIKSILICNEAADCKTSLSQKFELYMLKMQFKEEAKKQNTFMDQNFAELNTFMLFSQSFMGLQDNSEICAEKSIQFWYELLQDNPSLLRLSSIRQQIDKLRQKIRQSYDSCNEILPFSIKAAELYVSFLLKVIQNTDAYNKAYHIVSSLIKHDHETNMQVRRSMSKASRKTCILTVGATKNIVGTILSCNSQVKQLFGYDRMELTNQKISKLMPKVYHDIHDRMLTNFISQQDKYIQPQRIKIPTMNQRGFLVMCDQLFKITSSIAQGFQFICFLSQQKDESGQMAHPNYLIYCEPSGQIEAISEIKLERYHLGKLPALITNISIDVMFPKTDLSKMGEMGEETVDSIIDKRVFMPGITREELELLEFTESTEFDLPVKLNIQKVTKKDSAIKIKRVKFYIYGQLRYHRSASTLVLFENGMTILQKAIEQSKPSKQQEAVQNKVKHFVERQKIEQRFKILSSTMMVNMLLWIAVSIVSLSMSLSEISTFSRELVNLNRTTEMSVLTGNILSSTIMLTKATELNFTQADISIRTNQLSKDLNLLSLDAKYLTVETSNFLIEPSDVFEFWNGNVTLTLHQGISQLVYNGISFLKNQSITNNLFYIQKNAPIRIPTLLSNVQQQQRQELNNQAQEEGARKQWMVVATITVTLLSLGLLGLLALKIYKYKKNLLGILNSLELDFVVNIRQKCEGFMLSFFELNQVVKTVRNNKDIVMAIKNLADKTEQNKKQNQSESEDEHKSILPEEALNIEESGPKLIRPVTLFSFNNKHYLVVGCLLVFMILMSEFLIQWQLSIQPAAYLIQFKILNEIVRYNRMVSIFAYEYILKHNYSSQFYSTAGLLYSSTEQLYSLRPDIHQNRKTVYGQVQLMKSLLLEEKQSPGSVTLLQLRWPIQKLDSVQINLSLESEDLLSEIDEFMQNVYAKIARLKCAIGVIVFLGVFAMLWNVLYRQLRKRCEALRGLLEMMPDKIISQEKAIIDILDQK